MLIKTEKAYRWVLENFTLLLNENTAFSETVSRIISGDEKKAQILKELLLADLGIVDVAIKKIMLMLLSSLLLIGY